MVGQHIFIHKMAKRKLMVDDMMKELRFEKTVLIGTALMALFLVVIQSLS